MRKLLLPSVWMVTAVVAVVVVGAVAGYSYVFGLGDDAGSDIAAARPVTTQEPTTTSTTRPRPRPTTTTLPPVEQPAPADMPPLPAGGLSQGDSGDDVLVYEYRLATLRFDPGEVDGIFDTETRYAVEAVQKLYGVERTGRIDEGVRFGLSSFRWPNSIVKNGEPDRAEVDLDRQVMVLYLDREIRLITAVSTGSGKRYCGGDQGCQYATTPPGRFTFTWHYNGWRTSKLGHLYNPYYFNGGIAVHGYSSVPVYNASHGCVRIPMHVAEYFPDLVYKDMAIYAVGTAAGPYGAAPGNPTGPTTPTATTTPTTTPSTGTTTPGTASTSTTQPSSSTSSTGTSATTATTSPATTAAPTTTATTATSTTTAATTPSTTAPPSSTAPPGP